MAEEKIEIEWFIYFISAVILLCFYLVFTTPFEKLVLGAWIYYLIYNGIVRFISNFFGKKQMLITIVKYTIGLPITIIKFVFYSWHYFMQVTFFLIITFGVLPSLVMMVINERYYLGALYLGVLISVTFFAYLGHLLWKFVKRLYGNKSENIIIKKSNNIVIMYIIMISVYAVYNFLEFSEIDISYFINPSTFLVLKEVLVTFIAIDGLRQLFENKSINKKEKEI